MFVHAGGRCGGPNLHTDWPRLHRIQNRFNSICMLTLLNDSVVFYVALK